MEEKSKFGQTVVATDAVASLDPRSRSIAEKRAIGLTHKQIASLHGVATKTVQRTLEKPEVKALVDELQSELYSQSTSQLLNLLGGAVTTLEGLIDSDSDSIRLRAASKILDMAGPLVANRAREQQFERIVESIEARLQEL